MTTIPPAAVLFKVATLALGTLVTYLAAKAAWRTGARGLTYLALGFAVVSLGSLLAGVADQFLTVDAGTALVLESALTAGGFGVVAYSLYVTDGA